MISKNGLTIVKITIILYYPNFFSTKFETEGNGYASAGITETYILSFLPLRNATTPSLNANKVKSLPTPTFLPG